MRTVVALVVLLAVAPARALDGRRLHVHRRRLLDERRREVTLRGVNARVEGIFDVTFDDGRLPLEAIPVFDDGDAATMESVSTCSACRSAGARSSPRAAASTRHTSTGSRACWPSAARTASWCCSTSTRTRSP